MWSSRTSKRGSSRAPSAASPAPRPPDAPVPAPKRRSVPVGARVRSRTYAHWSRAAASSSTWGGVAPFCGPKTRATPRGPHRRLYGLQATRISTSPRRGSSPVASMSWIRFSSLPPGASSRPSASSRRAPRAWSAPAPPSDVPESPQPTRMRRTPRPSAARISSPTPYVVVAPGSRRERGTRDRPATAAISTTALLVTEQREVGADGLTDGPGGGQRHEAAAGGRGERTGGALAAVDQGDQVDVRVGDDTAHPGGDGLGGRLGGQRLLEAAGRHGETGEGERHGFNFLR